MKNNTQCPLEQELIKVQKTKAPIAMRNGKFKEFNEELEHNFWRVIGCQDHQVVEPCGNKAERGVPHKASCDRCPLKEEISSFSSKEF